MKYLVILLIVLGGIWWIRQQRKPNKPAPPPSGTQTMLPCAHCGTHVPEDEALPGKQGVYCSEAHRHTHEG
jgi:uncharacterized protein